MRRRIALTGNEQLPSGLLDNTAGLFITGDVGSGKSVLGREIHRDLAMSGDATVIVLDPDNDFFEDCLRDVSDMPASVRERAYAFFPADPNWPVGPINPLSVHADATTSAYEYEARLSCRALHASHLLLSSVNQQDFDGAPNLLKWSTTICRSLAKMNMTLPDAEQFFDIGSDDFYLLTSAIPDAMAKMEFARLAAQKLDRQEELIASFKNRAMALLENPFVRAHLGAVAGTLPLRELMQANSLLYFNLSQGQATLSPEAQCLLANIILSEILHILFTTPRAQRKFVVLICDELPFFRTSAAMISRSLRRSRKLGFRFIGMAQGARVFPDSTDDPLLHAMTSCCNSVILRHRDPSDAEFFGQLLSLPTRSATRVKYEHVEDQQIQVGNRIEITVTRAIASAYSDSEGESGSEGQQQGEGTDSNWSNAANAQSSHTESDNESKSAGTSESESEQQSQQLSTVGSMYAKACSAAAAQGTARSNNSAKAVGHGQSDAVSRGLTQSHGGSQNRNQGWSQESSWSRSRNHSGSTSVSYSQQIVPVLAWRKIVRVELMSLSEQDQELASHLAKLLTGEAFFYAAGEPIVKAYVNRSPDFLLEAPETAARLHRQLLDEMFAAPFYQFGDVILQQREVTRELFLTDLRQYAIEGRLPLRKCFVATEVPNLSAGSDGTLQTPPSTTAASGTVTGNAQLILPDDKLRNAPWAI